MQLSVPMPWNRLSGSVQEKARELSWETRLLLRLGQTWPERLSLLRFAAELYAARLAPADSYRWETTIRFRNATYRVGVRTSEIYIFHEIYESRQYARLPAYVPKPDWTVFDVGANIGVFTVQQAMAGAQLYAFEPNPDCYRRLSRNIAANLLGSRARAFPAALGAAAGQGALQVERGGTTGGVVLPAADSPSGEGLAVNIVALDDLLPTLNVSRIDLLKMDCEGSEVSVLQGAEKSLALVQRIIVEYHSRDLLRRVQEILLRNGFRQETIVDYYAEDLAHGIEEVGLLYARRPEAAEADA